MLETIYKTKQKRDYLNKSFTVVDTSDTSPNYFNIFSIPTVLTAGKNVIRLGVDGPFLKRGYEIDLEVLDVDGNPIFNEYTGFQDRYGYHYLTINVYDLSPPGIGSITLVGVASHDLNGNLLQYRASQHEKEFTVRWTKQVDIKSTDRNTTDIIFQSSPEVTVTQVLTPYKFNLGTYSINSGLVTQSIAGLSLYTTNVAGFDFIQNKSKNITDVASIENSYNYFLQSSTANIVQTNIRKYNKDIINGFVYSEYSRYNAVLFDSQARFTKDMEGSVFSFADLDGGTSITNNWTFPAELSSSYIQISGSKSSLPTQLRNYTPKIVTVYNSKYALLDSTPTIQVVDTQNTRRPIIRDYEIRKISGITGSFTYPASSLTEVQSTNLSSSYIQFTVMNLNPIAGDVYRIKTFAKEAGRNAEYYQLNDHIVTAPEFLTDSDKQNQAVYAKNKSDFFVYGEFTSASVAIDYWRGFQIIGNTINQYSFNLSSSAVTTNYPLANSLIMTSTNTVKKGTTTKYYQTYTPEQPYSLSFYCTLDAESELEVYMSSTPLKDTVLGLQAPRAFNQSRDTTGYTAYNKLGKLVGKISNISGSVTKAYDNVVFDFFSDADGFGRPVFLLSTNNATSASCYISSVSITPLDLVGYTPSILQFATTTPDSINILQDDDATLSQSLDLKIEYFTVDGKQSEYVTYIPNVQINMINEVPGFCTEEAQRFNDHCPFYYEVAYFAEDDSLTFDEYKPNTATVTTNPTLHNNAYFWPTYSLNAYGNSYWNVNSFAITGSTYNTLRYTTPASASITSSWKRYDPYLPQYTATIPGNYGFTAMYSSSGTPPSYSASPIDGILTSTSSYDRRFYEGTGVAIDKYDLVYSQSLLLFYSNSFDIQSNAVDLANLETYLKKSRLYYPTVGSTQDYGFHENGGIYNVRFKIMTFPPTIKGFGLVNYPGDTDVLGTLLGSQVANYSKTRNRSRFTPETGAKLMVYIADVATPVTNSILVPGREGFFPPQNNIVTIGNGYSITPTMTFYDSGSGYNVDQYDLVLVQYGERAQLVFDACGLEYELDTNGYYKIYNNTSQAFWGGIISDIEWCKIGVTTDPRFIKPVNFSDAFNTFVAVVPPPPPPPTPEGA